MRLNVILQENYRELLQTIREHLFPGTSSKELRDSYVLNWCIENFDGRIDLLKSYIKKRSVPLSENKNVAITANANEILRTLADEKLKESVNVTLRGLLEYSAAQISQGETPAPPPLTAPERVLLLNKTAEAELQLAKAAEAIGQIKALLRQEEKEETA